MKRPRYEELYTIKDGRAYCKQPRFTANYTWNRESGTSHPLNHYRQKHSKELDKHSQSMDSNWAAFSSQLSNLKNDPSSASVIVRAVKSYELYTQNSITDVVNAICSGKPCNTESQAWLKSLWMERAEDLDCLITMKSFPSTVQSDVLSRLASFQKMILDRILLSEAQVEQVVSRHKAIHTTMRANLSPDIVQKVLYIQYNGKMCGLRSVADKEDKIVDEENCFMPLFVE